MIHNDLTKSPKTGARKDPQIQVTIMHVLQTQQKGIKGIQENVLCSSMLQTVRSYLESVE